MKSLTKKTVLILSVISLGLVFVFDKADDVGLCSLSLLSTRECWDFFESLAFVLFFVSPLVLLFSLLTFWMKEEVFRAWFKFARWYVPFMVIGYFIYPGGGSHSFGAGGAMADSFNALVYIVFISIFVITSIVKIVRAHKKFKN